ncbi:alpha/beta hydrolase family protein [Brassicibacter mesophilus]|uniref:alpha/beta hydrolase family protein n=1 Tax=Brassicibacter mesophilus TaxID=745119 RepID=UPI003D19DF30
MKKYSNYYLVKDKISRVLIVGLLLSSMLLAACSAENNMKEPNVSKEIQHTIEELEYVDVKLTESPQYQYNVKEFDLGKREYQLPNGGNMPYKLRGIIGMPEGDGPFPLVMITHGSHENLKENVRFDTGFKYLVEAFAQQGIIAISMDMSQAYVWKYGDGDDGEKSVFMATDHLNHLVQASEGKETKYPVELKGKIDFENMSLIGHSRGGETIMDIAENMDSKGYPVSSMLSIAPTLIQAEHTYPESDVAILVPEYDGDVIGFDGFLIYDMLNEKTDGSHSITLLKGANHNYFNRNIEHNDAAIVRTEAELNDQITREAQENFLKNFAVDFISGGLKDGKHHAAFDLNNPQPNTMYGENVKVLFRKSGSNGIVDMANSENYAIENITASYVIDSWWYKLDEVYADTITSGEGEQKTRGFLKVKWDQNTSKITFKPIMQDISNYKSLSIDILVDPADSDNQNRSYQEFKVRLVDEMGNTATVTLPDKLNALSLTPGELKRTEIFEEELFYWSKPTPLGSLMLPLDKFKNIELDKITSLELVFDQTTSGSILIENIRLQ